MTTARHPALEIPRDVGRRLARAERRRPVGGTITSPPSSRTAISNVARVRSDGLSKMQRDVQRRQRLRRRRAPAERRSCFMRAAQAQRFVDAARRSKSRTDRKSFGASRARRTTMTPAGARHARAETGSECRGAEDGRACLMAIVELRGQRLGSHRLRWSQRFRRLATSDIPR